MLIAVHSVVDVITNSSTVVYTTASQSTINTIELIVDSVLARAGSNLKATDLFEFKIAYDPDRVHQWRWETWLDRHATPEQRNLGWYEKSKLYAKFEKGDPPEWWDDYKPSDDWDDFESIYVEVTAKREEDEELAKVLSTLHTLFGLTAIRDG
jgi:hypothetical protein